MDIEAEREEATMPKKHKINLSADERHQLADWVNKGKRSARSINRARMLLMADEGKTDQAIVESLGVSVSTVERTRRTWAEHGLSAALDEKPRPGRRRKLDGKQEAFLVALACSEAPEGRDEWSMQLLADKLVELGVVEQAISDETVRLRLKKMNLSRG